MKATVSERGTFFDNPMLDADLPIVNEAFWSSLVGHIERDCTNSPRVVLDVGCHTGGLLLELNRRFSPAEVFGLQPLSEAR